MTINRPTEVTVITKREMKTISRKDLERSYRHLMQVVPAIIEMNSVMGKPFERVESGPVQFGDSYGVFLRGNDLKLLSSVLHFVYDGLEEMSQGFVQDFDDWVNKASCGYGRKLTVIDSK